VAQSSSSLSRLAFQPQKQVRKPSRVRKSDQVAARKRLRVHPQAIASDAFLELKGEEAIVRRGDDADGYGRPMAKGAGLPEYRFRLWTLTGRTVAQHCLRDIVKKVGWQIELRAVAACLSGRYARFDGAGVFPPGPGGLIRSRYHCVYENEHADADPRADQWGNEAAERLGHENHIRPFSNRADNKLDIVIQTHALVVTRQVHSNRLVARTL